MPREMLITGRPLEDEESRRKMLMMKRTLFEGRDGKIKLLGRTKSRKRKKEYDRERSALVVHM